MSRVGLVLDQIIFAREGQYSTDEPFILFLRDVFLPAFDRVELCSRVRPGPGAGPYALEPPGIGVVPLPFYRDIPQLCRRAPILFPRITRHLSGRMEEWDLVVACGVHPLSSLALRMARRRRRPAVLWLRGDLEADLAHRLAGWRKVAALAAARLTRSAIPSGLPVVSMGRDDYPLLARMGPVHVAYSSKFSDEDFVPPSARRGAAPRARLLYVGRLAPEKGLEVLLEALAILDRAGRPADLTVIGSDYHGSRYGEAFAARVRASPLGGRISLAGHLPYGPELLRAYDEHDLLILPSYTEGFPQVLLEAMVRRCPVVATAVGGVPRLVRDGVNGLLVPPGDAPALARAIERILADPGLAARLAVAGQEAARPLTRAVQVRSVRRFLAGAFPGAPFTARLA